MAINITDTLQRGGPDMIQLLTYCVYTQRVDIIFELLVKNYQLLPSADKAVALYDAFVLAPAPLVLSVSKVDKSSDWQLIQTVDKIRAADQLVGQPVNADMEESPLHVRFLPAKNCFNGLLEKTITHSTQFETIASEYDPALSAVENLPDGKLTTLQREYNQKVWVPARSRLSASGFFMIANVGG